MPAGEVWAFCFRVGAYLSLLPGELKWIHARNDERPVERKSILNLSKG